jgi:hypothetical protein
MSQQGSRHAIREGSFDELAKGLASGTVSRSKALRLMGAALVGGALASFPGAAWAARPECPSGVRCKGQCCPEGATCEKGAGGGCTCPSDTTNCGGVCTDLLASDSNCGSCGNACVTGASCVAGGCQCPSGQLECGGQCVSTACPEGQTFNPDLCGCVPSVSTCTESTETDACGTSPDFRSVCRCLPDVDGTPTCIRSSAGGDETRCTPCTSNSDCPSTHLCMNFGNQGPICWPRCESENGLMCPADHQ